MAPVDPGAEISNFIPIGAYFARIVSIGLLLLVIVRFIDQASAALPPSQDTRHRQSKRKRAVRIFTSLAALSFLLASYFGISRRVSSYLDWSSHQSADAPNTLWGGWYGGTSRDREGGSLTSYADLRLGRWWQDTKFSTEAERLVLRNSKGFWWAQQLVPSLIAWSIFVGLEGKRRNMPKLVLFAFVALAQTVSLSFAQSLFWITLLLTPVPVTPSKTSKGDPQWMPKPIAYLLPIVMSLACATVMPHAFDYPLLVRPLRALYFGVLVIPALLPRTTPKILGSTHSSNHSPHRANSTIFKSLSVLSFLLHAKQTTTALFDNSPSPQYHSYSYIWNVHPKDEHSTFYLARTAFTRVLGALSDNPAISAVAWDVLLSALTLCVWAVVRGLDVDNILSCAIPFKNAHKGEKHVSFEGEKPSTNGPPDSTAVSPKSTKRGRGRPKKDIGTPFALTSSSTTSGRGLRKSTRHRRNASTTSNVSHEVDESEEDYSGTYVPPPAAAAEVAGLEHEDEGAETVVEEAEAAALGWGLFALGGLGAVSAGVLGAEACGR